ncbi:glutathione S-transferase Mu 1 [Folsomia candida]|uniref:glutathione transferase n=1 Tax=Folsomia candida TaxID=158441 RepID=A0A226EF90_FOLCA|nr:glutathione S-transferase Mu 1 [Folsomia candida]OXA56303.1 Glutathione S-transferase Mu 1 [Folsomia candida]
MAPIILAYWDIRGFAQPIRLLLANSGLEWEDKLYVTGPAPTFDKTCWFGEKETLGFDFPNLPYLIDGDVKVTQTIAIIRYLARKTGLAGQSDDQQRRIDLITEEWHDFKGPFYPLCYNPEFHSLKPAYLTNAALKLARFSKYLGDMAWFAGDKLTYVDFLMYEIFDEHKLLEPTILSAFPNLEEFQARFEALPKIAEFIASPKFIKYPINNRMATFGG